MIAATPRDRLRDALTFGSADLARLLPELSGVFGASAGADDQAPPGSPAARFRLFDAVTDLLDVIADEPLAIVLDDLHWRTARACCCCGSWD